MNNKNNNIVNQIKTNIKSMPKDKKFSLIAICFIFIVIFSLITIFIPAINGNNQQKTYSLNNSSTSQELKKYHEKDKDLNIIRENINKLNETHKTPSNFRTYSEVNGNDKDNKGQPYGILISKNGLNKIIKNKPTVSIYVDPQCPYCHMLMRNIIKSINYKYENEDINLDLHTISFLDSQSEDKFSSRAANSWMYIANKYPQYALVYMYGLDTIQPEEGSHITTPNSKFIALMKSLGINEEDAQESMEDHYSQYIHQITQYIANDKGLVGKEGFSTPTVLVNNKLFEWSSYDKANVELNKMINNASIQP